jgi:hypothetical protein
MIIGGAVVGTFIINTLYQISRSFSQNNRLGYIINAVNKSTIASKEFLLNSYTDEQFYQTGHNAATINFDSSFSDATEELLHFKKDLKSNDTEIDSILPSLELFQKTFLDMVSVYKEKGFKDIGIEGKMRKAVHNIEHAEFLPDLKPLLSLRRHEKDFILRKDLAYTDKYNKEWQSLYDFYLANNSFSEEEKSLLTTEMNNYKNAFYQIVEIEKLIGLNTKEGLRNEIVKRQHQLEAQLLKVQTKLEKQTEQSIFNLKIVIWAVSVLLLMFFILISGLFTIFNNTVRKPVLELKSAAEEVSIGNLSIDIEDLKKYSLLKELTISIEQIIHKFKETIQTVESIAKNDNSKAIEIQNEKDEVGKALNTISKEIGEMRQHEIRRSWHNEGLAMFSEIIREQNNIEMFAEKSVKAIVKYLVINQASLFVVSDQESGKQLELKAVYAYDRKKFAEKTILPGEGLIGQCYLEKESILLTEVPKNYIHITSGLGEATPTCIYILACKTKDHVEAILELASFAILDKHHLEFLEKIGESIASTIYFIRINDKTSNLMLGFKEQTEALKMQEEEMRQNLEELSATQEEMTRRENGYKSRIAKLESELHV